MKRKTFWASCLVGITAIAAWMGGFITATVEGEKREKETLFQFSSQLASSYDSMNQSDFSTLVFSFGYRVYSAAPIRDSALSAPPSFIGSAQGLDYSKNTAWVTVNSPDGTPLLFTEEIPSYLSTSFWFASAGTPSLALLSGGFLVLGYLSDRKDAQELNRALRSLSKTAGTDLEGYDSVSDYRVMAHSIALSSTYLELKISELEREKKKTETLLNSMSGLFLALDQKGDLVIENANAIMTLGEDPDKFPPEIADAYAKAEQGENVGPFDLELNGRIFAIQTRVFPFSGQGDRTVQAVAFTGIDATESRSKEKAKIDFFSYASHELKSPLTSIIGFQEMIRSGLLTDKEEINKALDQSIRQAKDMSAMIRDMLDLSALDSKRKRDTVSLDLAEVCRSCIAATAPAAEKKGVEIFSDLGNLEIKMNSQDAERLVRNLLDNAIKYNRENGHVFIRTDSKGRTFTVADTGIGMSKEDAAHCFDRFFRAKDVQAEGSGLGLTIVRHVCLYYGFDIKVESEPGKGTTFTVKLPKEPLIWPDRRE